MSNTKTMPAKRVKAKAAPKKSNFFTRFRVNLKLRSPEGIVLTQGETEAFIDIQNEDIKVLKENQQEVLAAIGVTRSVEIGSQIKKSQSARSVAAATYMKTIDPIKKREWARRLVVADETRSTLVGISSKMLATKDRLEMIKGDMELQLLEAEARLAETEAYAKAGNQLRLAGESLVIARTRAQKSDIEYTNLEVTMEGAEKMIKDLPAEDILARADKLLGIGAKETEDDE